MEEYTYIEILIEDKSGAILIEHIMNKYGMGKENFEYKIHSFKGIGKIPPKITNVSQVKTHRLLTDVPMYLKGMDAKLRNMSGKRAIFVVLDSDNEDCAKLKKDLVQMYESLAIAIPVYFCIAIEEMEAWLLGDSEALLKAYPTAKRPLLQKYVPDSIIGTWEYLADVVYKGGVQALKRAATSYYEIGAFKCDCANNIGEWLEIRKNTSPSFNYFIRKLDSFCSENA
ncbi:MAG: DUF4276 family protein [Lachnospiraceae bacterium]|nr:DUF4276 family protein [Lachnospiraceae bacterium]